MNRVVAFIEQRINQEITTVKKMMLSTAAVVALGYANADGSKPAKAAKSAPTPTPAPKPQVEIVVGDLPEGFTPPAKKTATKYPFDQLEVGKVFGVKGKTKRQMTSTVAAANDRYSSVGKNAEGKKVRTNIERGFYAVDVDQATAKTLEGTALEGSTVLVIRSK